ncbi:MAG TPA: ABC transporter substrate-binding protein [Acidimicrobiales bacterium]|nr:ABC transporter substrate-binding protein [Acidimicrobiales bacterium]
MSEEGAPTSLVGSGSKLRLSVISRDRRLLRGYGPLAALLVAFVLMAMLVPTVAPTQVTVHDTRTVKTSGAGGTAGGSGNGTASNTSPGSAGGTAGTSGTPASGGSASGGGTSGPRTLGKTSACGGQAEQVPGDPYSPPCIAFSGSNGGASSPGVSANQINLTFRTAAGSQSFQQALAQLGGANITDTDADVQRTINALATYFDTHFQFYGRKLNIEYYNGQGNETNELLGTGQQQANADAVTAAQSLHAFGELNGTTEPYDVALAGQKVMSFGAPYLSAQFMGQYDPYMWSIAPECNDVVQVTEEFALKTLASTNATWAGGSLQGKPRKVAIIAPSDPWYQACANVAVQEAAAAGHPVTDDIQYQLNLSTASSQAATIISQLQNDGITTVVCGCDPVTPAFLTSRAQQQGYTPEWVVAGTALTDFDLVGQLFQQNEWSHAFGVSFLGPITGKQDTFGYAAYKAVNPRSEPANAVDLIYEQLYQIAIGIQMAGPDLTPQTFEAGMRAYPGSQANSPHALYGTWAFPPGHYTPEVDSVEIYWDPNKVSPYNGCAGAYVQMSPRYRANQYPVGPPPIPSTFPITPNPNNPPCH